MTGPDTGIGRRHLLTGGAAATGLALGWGAHAVAAPSGSTSGDPSEAGPDPSLEVEPFHGPHQSGVATPAQAHVSLLGLDLARDVDAEALGRLLRLLTDDASRLTRGEPSITDTEPELARGPSRLTVTVGLGPRVFADVLGRADLEGAPVPLPAFSRDRLEERWGQSDLLLQLCGDDPTTVSHARRVLLRTARSFCETADSGAVRWRQDGFRPARGSRASLQADTGSMRNLMGQADGTVNPAPGSAEFDDRVWIGGDGPLAGGTQVVLRRIRMNLDTWEKVDRRSREFTVGRTLDTGAPLTGTTESDSPDFEAVDSYGFPVIDRAAHIRRAHAFDPTERMLRRGYNYDDLDGEEPEAGLLFLAYQADAQRQFVPTQARLDEADLLNQWVTAVGSGIWTVLPGCAPGGFLGETLL